MLIMRCSPHRNQQVNEACCLLFFNVGGDTISAKKIPSVIFLLDCLLITEKYLQTEIYLSFLLLNMTDQGQEDVILEYINITYIPECYYHHYGIHCINISSCCNAEILL